MTQEVETKSLINIRGKIQHYLLIGKGENQVIINIGEKTVTAVNNLNKQLELPLEEKGGKK